MIEDEEHHELEDDETLDLYERQGKEMDFNEEEDQMPREITEPEFRLLKRIRDIENDRIIFNLKAKPIFFNKKIILEKM